MLFSFRTKNMLPFPFSGSLKSYPFDHKSKPISLSPCSQHIHYLQLFDFIRYFIRSNKSANEQKQIKLYCFYINFKVCLASMSFVLKLLYIHSLMQWLIGIEYFYGAGCCKRYWINKEALICSIKLGSNIVEIFNLRVVNLIV